MPAPTDTTWLDVPFADKDAAKKAGARWDRARRQWYAPTPAALDRCRQWAAGPDVPSVLPGEDRAFGQGLFVDMVPTSCWFTNVRTCVEPTDWDRLRRMVYARAGHVCEVCGARPARARGQWLEAHERWLYDEASGVQVLRRLIALCTACHRATHFGYAQGRGSESQAREQLRAVNGWSTSDVDLHIEGTAEIWYARCLRTWDLDLGMLTRAGVRVRRPPAAHERTNAARPEER